MDDCYYHIIIGYLSPPNVTILPNQILITWAKPESLAEPSDFRYVVQVITTNNTVIHSTTTTTANLTLNNSIADSNDCTKYYISITPIANSGKGIPTESGMFIFPQGMLLVLLSVQCLN